MAIDSRYLQRRRTATRLMVTRVKAKEVLDGILDRGRQLLAREVSSGDDDGYYDLVRGLRSWDEASLSALERLFDDTAWAEEYEDRTRSASPGGRDAAESARFLKSQVKDRLAVIEMTVQALAETELSPAIAPPSRGVFVVYGHDREAKALVTLFIERVGLDPVVFDEQPMGGRSAIEQLEHLAGAVSYTIVVLTPDDFGGSAALPEQARRRARQNVIFELGYFAARLGRGRVCALLRGDVEIPSDYQGVLYIVMDQSDAWRLNVAREMRAAGLAVDTTKLIP